MAPERKFDHDEARRLRATGEFSVDELADHFGVTKGAITQATKMVAPNQTVAARSRVPETATEMLELALPDLWAAFKGSKGIARKAAFEAIAAAAKREQAENGPPKEPDPLIADVVTGVASLSPTRRREILAAEQAKLQVELAAVEGALDLMNEAVLV